MQAFAVANWYARTFIIFAPTNTNYEKLFYYRSKAIIYRNWCYVSRDRCKSRLHLLLAGDIDESEAKKKKKCFLLVAVVQLGKHLSTVCWMTLTKLAIPIVRVPRSVFLLFFFIILSSFLPLLRHLALTVKHVKSGLCYGFQSRLC